MILNLSDGTLSYSKNEQIQGVAFKIYQNPQTKYVMAITIGYEDEQITLLEYTNNIKKSDNDDNKQNATPLSILQGENKRLKLNLKTITQQMNEMKQVNSVMIIGLKDENAKKTIQLNKYQRQIEEQKICIESIKKEKILLEKNNNEKSTQIRIVTKLVNKLEDECKSLNDRICILEDERKEYEMNIHRLKKENKKLKLLNINTNNYKQWNVD
eukprot:166966_1